VKKSSYGERDYAFEQRMLRLRTSIGLTQAGLARLLGISRQALVEHPGVAFAVVWSPSGERLVSGGSDGMLRWWEVDSGHCLRVREAHQGTVQALKVSPDGSMLASCGDDGAILLWDLESGEPH
jgi:WD40 repeat protein